MIALAAAAVLAHGPNEKSYRLRVQAPPNSHVALRVSTASGWTGTFCTPQICALGKVTIVVPASGRAVSDVHLYRTGANAAITPHAAVSAGTSVLRLP